MIHCISSFCRGNKYRCYYELNDIRNITIDLISKRNNVESKKHRDIDKLSESDRKKIDELYVYPQDKYNLKNILIKNIELIYENLDYFKDKENINYEIEKEFFINYINENL